MHVSNAHVRKIWEAIVAVIYATAAIALSIIFASMFASALVGWII